MEYCTILYSTLALSLFWGDGYFSKEEETRSRRRMLSHKPVRHRAKTPPSVELHVYIIYMYYSKIIDTDAGAALHRVTTHVSSC